MLRCAGERGFPCEGKGSGIIKTKKFGRAARQKTKEAESHGRPGGTFVRQASPTAVTTHLRTPTGCPPPTSPPLKPSGPNTHEED